MVLAGISGADGLILCDWVQMGGSSLLAVIVLLPYASDSTVHCGPSIEPLNAKRIIMSKGTIVAVAIVLGLVLLQGQTSYVGRRIPTWPPAPEDIVNLAGRSILTRTAMDVYSVPGNRWLVVTDYPIDCKRPENRTFLSRCSLASMTPFREARGVMHGEEIGAR